MLTIRAAVDAKMMRAQGSPTVGPTSIGGDDVRRLGRRWWSLRFGYPEYVLLQRTTSTLLFGPLAFFFAPTPPVIDQREDPRECHRPKQKGIGMASLPEVLDVSRAHSDFLSGFLLTNGPPHFPQAMANRFGMATDSGGISPLPGYSSNTSLSQSPHQY